MSRRLKVNRGASNVPIPEGINEACYLSLIIIVVCRNVIEPAFDPGVSLCKPGSDAEVGTTSSSQKHSEI